MLLYGPPGTGKTQAVRALVGAAAVMAQPLALFSRRGADCLGKYSGEAERTLRLLFEEAQAKQPAIIFFDEIDGLAPARGCGRGGDQDATHASVVRGPLPSNPFTCSGRPLNSSTRFAQCESASSNKGAARVLSSALLPGNHAAGAAGWPAGARPIASQRIAAHRILSHRTVLTLSQRIAPAYRTCVSQCTCVSHRTCVRWRQLGLPAPIAADGTSASPHHFACPLCVPTLRAHFAVGPQARGAVCVIGATNRPDGIDSALRRPGRFDRELYFPLPPPPARAAILRLCTRAWRPQPPPALARA